MDAFRNQQSDGQQTATDRIAFDRDQALGRVGGDLDLLKEIAQLFLDETSAMLGAIDQAIAARDAKALERSAHTLKGCVANFDTGTCFNAALALEKAGRNQEFGEATECYRNLTRALDRLCPSLIDLANE
jgi:HPt (histidine-containing phosphotransfer) domain-containing protein